MRVLLAVLAAAFIWVSGCAATWPPAGRDQSEPGRPFTVAAAADLQLAFTELGREFEARTGRRVVFIFGSTGNLARQIEHGAPVDLFAAANVSFVEDLVQKGLLIPDTVQPYAVGLIVLASSKAAGVEVRDLAGLLDPRIKKVAIASPDHAPYGLAAKQALMNAGLWEAIQPRLVLGENVRQALQFVQSGNAEAGIVALAVAGVPEVTCVPIDRALYEPLRQALAVVTGSPYEAAAREFAAFVTGPEGRAVLARYGFLPPEGE